MSVFVIGCLCFGQAAVGAIPTADDVDSSGGDTHYYLGDNIFIDVTFSEAVTVDTSGGTPTIEIDLGVNREATYLGGSGTDTLTFRYTVQAGDFTADLECTSQFALQLNGGTIQSVSTAEDWAPQTIPQGTGNPDSLVSNRDILVGTASLTLTGSSIVQNGGNVTWTVTRDAGSAPITVDLSSANPAIASVPASVVIGAGDLDETFLVSGNSVGGPVTITATNASYNADTKDITVQGKTLNFLSPGTDPFYMDEGELKTDCVMTRTDTNGSMNVSFINSVNGVINNVGNAFFPNGDEFSANFDIQAIDDSAPGPSVTLTATAGQPGYNSPDIEIIVGNLDPELTSAIVPTNGMTVGQSANFSFQASDPALNSSDPVTGEWNFGDGTIVSGVNPGVTTSHTYFDIGQQTVTLTLTDDDGGSSVYQWTIEVDPGKALSITVLGGYCGAGDGWVTVSPSSVLTNGMYMYNEGQQVTITAMPDWPVSDGTNDYFYEWGGDVPDALTDTHTVGPDCPVTMMVVMDDDKNITLLFSREHMVEDFDGDLDCDFLADNWEDQWELDPKSAADPNGTFDNQDGDYLPGVAFSTNGQMYPYPEFPLDEELGYMPDIDHGFHNWYEYSGFDGTNGTIDDANLDPKDPDTDEDGLTDGWEYYFWANAMRNTNMTGRAYDPYNITNSIIISNSVIRSVLNPVASGGADLDPDNDGLDNIEEMVLGTDPIDWDTDKDGMPDGWEVLRELDPLEVSDGIENPDDDWMAEAGANQHWDVYDSVGFDPRTAWAQNYYDGNRNPQLQPNTRIYTSLDEFLVAQYFINHGYISNAIPEQWDETTTDPLNIDTDQDGMADGWELYVDLMPVGFYYNHIDPDLYNGMPSDDDAGLDSVLDNDGLTCLAEFRCYDLQTQYPTDFPVLDAEWQNKFWTTDPWNADTDGDQLADGSEGNNFKYGGGVSTEYAGAAYAGGGLNPCSCDTEADAIPDLWEALFPNGAAVGEDRTGMDGTVGDATGMDNDYDNDGLENYQEYWVNAVYHFQYFPPTPSYPFWIPGQGFGGYDPADFFLGVPHDWDWHAVQNTYPYTFIWAQPRPDSLHYSSTDPRMADSDWDNMDDFYELYHGLNPIYGTVDLVAGRNISAPTPDGADIRLNPYLIGHQAMDPDQDGLPNDKEALMPNYPDPQRYHSDPSPLWITDHSYQLSWVNLYYWQGSQPWYWDDPTWTPPPEYMFDFESNEGFDTDNDNIPDHRELVGGDSPGFTDPVDDEQPIKRRALKLDGTSAARTRGQFWHGFTEYETFTIEAWVRPEDAVSGTDQVIVEKTIGIPNNNPMGWLSGVRLNFRLAIDDTGHPYAEYNGSGYDPTTVDVKITGSEVLYDDEWVHLAAVYNGEEAMFKLYVNGNQVAGQPSGLIPVTGWFEGSPGRIFRGCVIVGAEDQNPGGYVANSLIQVGYAAGFYPGPSSVPNEPDLDLFFKGWVDEIRLWNGPRTESQINATMTSRMKRSDILASRAAALSDPTAPVLTDLWTFDDLPDPDWDPISPAGFPLLNGRPDDGSYPAIPWWQAATHKSLVYTDPFYIPWIANSAAQIPRDPPYDSQYWYKIQMDGTNAIATNVFPNASNPYTFQYNRYLAGTRLAPGDHFDYSNTPRENEDNPNMLYYRLYHSLLPLLHAEADEDVELWDGTGNTGRDPYDSDNDGIDDSWEELYGLDPLDSTGINGADADLDGDGLTNLEEFYVGTDPNMVDTDGDSVSDALEDADGDNLLNHDELVIHGTLPNMVDTDDDGLTDWEEVTGVEDTTYVRPPMSSPPVAVSDARSSRAPAAHRCASFDGNSRIVVPIQSKYASESWSIEVWVMPTVSQNSVLISRFVDFPGAIQDGVNYELGLSSAAAAGFVRPYARYQEPDKAEVRLDGLGGTDVFVPNADEQLEIPIGEWSHIAAVFNPDTFLFEIYINGERVVYRTDATGSPPLFPVLSLPARNQEITIGALRSTGAIVNGFIGSLDDLKIHKIALTADDVLMPFEFASPPALDNNANTIPFTGGGVMPDAGMSSSLQSLPPDQQVHAVVQFNSNPTAADISVLTGAGIQVFGKGGGKSAAVLATRAQLEDAGVSALLRHSGTFSAGNKVSPRLGVTGLQPARNVLVSFFEDVSESSAVSAAQDAGLFPFGGGYLSDKYMVVEANDTELMALAADDRVSWVVPASAHLTTGAPVFAFDSSSLPFEVFGDGWDGPGLGSANLTYYFVNSTPDLSVTEQQTTCVDMMNQWSQYADITWGAGSSAGANNAIDITWESIDGVHGVLAYAYYPSPPNSEPIAGDMFFDEDELWEINLTTGIRLDLVALHELGHALGLDHSDDPNAIMYPFYNQNATAVPKEDDINGIRSLYGEARAIGGDVIAYFTFNDAGLTAEDFTMLEDWIDDWEHAGIMDGALFGVATWDDYRDFDDDYLPDWWEQLHSLDPTSSQNTNGFEGDADGDLLLNLNEYLAGTDPNAYDSDHDGESDYLEDSDFDTLSNGHEQDLYKTNPGNADTDDDDANDGLEVSEGYKPTDSLSTYIPRAIDFTPAVGSSNIVVASDKIDGKYTGRLNLEVWTIECQVNPDVIPTGNCPLISRKDPVSNLRNYEIGITNGYPYVAFDPAEYGAAAVVVGGSQISTGNWTHIAGRFDEPGALTLFVDGQDAGEIQVLSESALGNGTVVMGSPEFDGRLMGVRIWRIAQSDQMIEELRKHTLFFGNIASLSGLLRSGEDGFLKENATTQRSGGLMIDELIDEWTLETWIKTTDSGRIIARRNGSAPDDTDFNYFLEIEDDGSLMGGFAIWYDVWITDTNGLPQYDRTEFSYNINDIDGEITLDDGEWHHVAYVRGESSCYLYVDGVIDAIQNRLLVPILSGDGEFIANAGVRSLQGPVVISENLASDMDEVRIWDIGHDSDSLLDINSRNLSGSERGIVSYFNFDYQLTDYADDRAERRNPTNEFGIYIGDAERISPVTDPVPIIYNPLLTLQSLALVAYFSGHDGGNTVEDFMHRMGLISFDFVKYAGIRGSNVLSVILTGDEWPEKPDSDSDGLPDSWETGYGLHPGTDEEDDGPYGDPDHDGLINLYEYLAFSEQAVELDPLSFGTLTTNVLSDYFTPIGVGQLTFGEYYDDTDVLPDIWEMKASRVDVMDRYYYHRDQDPDGDEWNNQEEYLAGTDPNDPADAPNPVVSGFLRYNGVILSDPSDGVSAHFHVLAYQTPTMDTEPRPAFMSENDGVVTFSFTNGVPGRTAYLFAYKSSETWQPFMAGDAYGFTGPIEMNVNGTADVEIHVMDQIKMPWYQAFSWTRPTDISDVYLRLTDLGSGQLIMTRWIHGDRNWYKSSMSGWPAPASWEQGEETFFFAVDYQQGEPTDEQDFSTGLPPGNYEWQISSNSLADPNAIFADGIFGVPNYTVPSNTVVSPVGGDIIRHQLYEFKWQMDAMQPMPSFDIQIAPTNDAWWRTRTIPAPVADASGIYKADMPIEDPLMDLFGGYGWPAINYHWRVRANNNGVLGDWSEYGKFTIAAADDRGDIPRIAGEVLYFGAATNEIIVRAYKVPDYGRLRPQGQVTLDSAGEFELTGLRHARYRLVAFIDSNKNDVRDEFEPQGMARDSVNGSHHEYRADKYASATYDLVSAQQVSGVRILIRDRDTDNDNLADGWEWENLHNSPQGMGHTGDEDMDGDGLSNMDEYVRRLNPISDDTDGDGLSDGDEVNVYGSDGTSSDSDGDSLLDGYEVAGGFNLMNADDDDDGVPTLIEVSWGGVPGSYNPATDINPLVLDTDGDAIGDLMEIAAGSDPLDDTDSGEVGITGVEMDPSGHMVVLWTVFANDNQVDVHYTVEQTDDLSDWSSVGSLVSDGESDADVNVMDSVAPGASGFYRLRLSIE